MPGETPFQTLGPFFSFALVYPSGGTVRTSATQGDPIRISGAVLDGAGAPIPDALVEIWQADASGHYRHPDDAGLENGGDGFDGFGRVGTDAEGRFVFETIKPGRVPGPDGEWQSPHILVSILGRGLLTRLVTRLYFEDDPSLASDPILSLVPVERRQTLIARREADGEYHFDIVIQGANETVFFDI